MTLTSSVTIKLQTPIEVGNDFIEEITLRRPKGKDMKTLTANAGTGDLMKLAARLSGQLPVVFDEMDGYDVAEVLTQVGNFLTSGPTTGA
jgi:hypothetical protein